MPRLFYTIRDAFALGTLWGMSVWLLIHIICHIIERI